MLHTLTTALTTGLLALHGWPVYLVIGVLAFLEAAAFVGLVVPGETGLILGGVLAAQGSISLGVLLPIAIVAAIAGDSAGYEIGRRLGPSMRRSRLGRRLGEESWDRAEALLRRRGSFAVVVGRFVGVLRAVVPAVAGASRMPYRQFLAANAVGGILWAVMVSGVGFLFGAAWQQAQGPLTVVGAVAGTAVTVWLLTGWARARRRGDEGALRTRLVTTGPAQCAELPAGTGGEAKGVPERPVRSRQVPLSGFVAQWVRSHGHLPKGPLMRLKKIVVGGTAAAALGLAALVGTGTAFAASPAPAPVDQTSTVAPAAEPVGTDTDTLQEGDQTTPDTGTEAADPAESATESATESSTESAADSDGPGGHADPAGEVDHQFDGQE